MNALDHPLKRLAFVGLLLSLAASIALLLLPSPFRYETVKRWEDVPVSTTPERLVTRIDSTCAGREMGSREVFAHDFFLVNSEASESPYSRLLAEVRIQSKERPTIADTVDLTAREKASFVEQLNGEKKVCLRDDCVHRLTAQLFAAILVDCSKLVGQSQVEKSVFEWRIGTNINNNEDAILIALVVATLFLFTSVLYNKTLGPFVKWIRTGSWR